MATKIVTLRVPEELLDTIDRLSILHHGSRTAWMLDAMRHRAAEIDGPSEEEPASIRAAVAALQVAIPPAPPGFSTALAPPVQRGPVEPRFKTKGKW